jgi:heme/copper-type cytochrome/quinol oxidase subunit 2
MVGVSGLVFVVVTSSLLSAVIVRSPQTHDHIARSLRHDYARTPLDSVEAADLPAILADLPEFSFPDLVKVAAAQGPPAAGETAHTAGDEHNLAEHATATQQLQMQTITLRQSEYGFDPDRVELQAGVPVELTVTNEGEQVHGIWVPDLAIMEDIRSGKTKVFTFTPEKAGRIPFTCSYNLCGTEEEHAQMKGFITVR